MLWYMLTASAVNRGVLPPKLESDTIILGALGFLG
jgi:hypothetical protein